MAKVSEVMVSPFPLLSCCLPFLLLSGCACAMRHRCSASTGPDRFHSYDLPCPAFFFGVVSVNRVQENADDSYEPEEEGEGKQYFRL